MVAVIAAVVVYVLAGLAADGLLAVGALTGLAAYVTVSVVAAGQHSRIRLPL